jgi:hypothetical protein
MDHLTQIPIVFGPRNYFRNIELKMLKDQNKNIPKRSPMIEFRGKSTNEDDSQKETKNMDMFELKIKPVEI